MEKEGVRGESKSLFFGRCGLEKGGRETRKSQLKKRKGLVSLRPCQRKGLAKRDESSILRGRARLFLTQSKGGSCEARRIVDPSIMGSSLFDPVKRRVLRSKTNRRSFDDGSFCSLSGSRTLLFSSPKVSSREEGLVSL